MVSKSRKAKSKKAPKRRKPTTTSAHDPEKLRRRIARVRPIACSGELSVDVAVFDNAVLSQLDDSLAEEVQRVRAALKLVSDGFDDDASNQLAPIARRSPLSEWRLFVRGLSDWYANRVDEAQECWKRLDFQRRPGRMARALMASLRSDLDVLVSAVSTSHLGQQAHEGHSILTAAQLVRRTRVNRPALAEALREISRREFAPPGISDQVRIGPERLAWVIEFSKEYQTFEPQLVAALQAEAYSRVMKQPFADIHQNAMKALPGPAHDPNNLLHRSIYLRQFQDGAKESAALLKRYLTTSLPKNDRISPQLRGAIECEIYLDQARDEIEGNDDGSLLSRFMRKPVDEKQVDRLYRRALAAYPTHSDAHREYVDWLREHVDDDRIRKAERTTFEDRLLPAMQAWSTAVPDEIEPRLWLVDHYLENEELEEAQPHVQWLAGSRHADPRVRATPWKWELLEAMRLCRRKSWLKDASAKLDAADKLWPAWLRRDWLPYLRAALLLRQNQTEQFMAARAAIRENRSSDGQPFYEVTDAAMMLGAAQLMRVPAADLKPLRQPVDNAVKNASQVSLPDLIQLACFFWDLHRTNLLYPAYRMHGGKFAAALDNRLKAAKPGKLDGLLGTSALDEAFYWLATRRVFSDSTQFKFPLPLPKLVSPLTRAVAAIESYLVEPARRRWNLRDHTSEINIVREAAATQQDPYYRYWFGALADRASVSIEQSRISAAGFNPFGSFGLNIDDDDDDDLCMCPECKRRRANEQAGIPYDDGYSEVYDDDYLDSDEVDVTQNEQSTSTIDLDRNSTNNDSKYDPIVEPPKPPSPKLEPASDPELKRKRPKDPMGKKRKKRKR
jgi:hypothetical protein